jgi:hypothetical protein
LAREWLMILLAVWIVILLVVNYWLHEEVGQPPDPRFNGEEWL